MKLRDGSVRFSGRRSRALGDSVDSNFSSLSEGLRARRIALGGGLFREKIER
jgi:hypothetical protein